MIGPVNPMPPTQQAPVWRQPAQMPTSNMDRDAGMAINTVPMGQMGQGAAMMQNAPTAQGMPSMPPIQSQAFQIGITQSDPDPFETPLERAGIMEQQRITAEALRGR